MAPKFLLGRDNVGADTHIRRLCFNYQIGKCNEAADGAECPRLAFVCNVDAMHPMQNKVTTPERSDS